MSIYELKVTLTTDQSGNRDRSRHFIFSIHNLEIDLSGNLYLIPKIQSEGSVTESHVRQTSTDYKISLIWPLYYWSLIWSFIQLILRFFSWPRPNAVHCSSSRLLAADRSHNSREEQQLTWFSPLCHQSTNNTKCLVKPRQLLIFIDSTPRHDYILNHDCLLMTVCLGWGAKAPLQKETTAQVLEKVFCGATDTAGVENSLQMHYCAVPKGYSSE